MHGAAAAQPLQQRRARGAAGGCAQDQRAAIAAQHGRKVLCGGYRVPRGQQQARPIVQRRLSLRAEAILVFVKVRVAQQRAAARYFLAGGQARGDVPFDILRAPSCQLAGRGQRHARHAARALLAAVEHAGNEQLRHPRAIERHPADVLADIHNQPPRVGMLGQRLPNLVRRLRVQEIIQPDIENPAVIQANIQPGHGDFLIAFVQCQRLYR